MRKAEIRLDLDLVVAERHEITRDVVELVLESSDRDPLPGWTPGAHIDVEIGPGLVRQYSLHGDPGMPEQWRISVLREPKSRGGSQRIHEAVRAGSRVRVTALRNRFHFDAGHSRYVFIAGGIGITPLLPMIAEADARRLEWELHYGGRSFASMAHLEQLLVYGDRVHIVPQDRYGLLGLDAICGAAEGAVIYCCGPEALLSAVEKACEGRLDVTLRTERFSAAPVEVVTDEEAAFDVVLRRSDRTLRVPADRSILDVITDAGIVVSMSCGEGTCGSCETEVVSGIPLHRDSVLTPAEWESNETLLICVSRARTPVLELDI